MRLIALLWLDPILQPSRVRHSRTWQHCLIGAMCQETARGEVLRNEPSNSRALLIHLDSSRTSSLVA